ncbi:MAG: hypothetical protein ACJAVF_002857, partial [Paraglaciecola sp.]
MLQKNHKMLRFASLREANFLEVKRLKKQGCSI